MLRSLFPAISSTLAATFPIAAPPSAAEGLDPALNIGDVLIAHLAMLSD